MVTIVDSVLVDEVLDRDSAIGRDAVFEALTYCRENRVIAPIKQYLQLPDAHTADRIIAMPVRITGTPLVGMKWIGSALVNRSLGAPRASAVIILNDPDTHVVETIVSGARISCERTAWAALIASAHAVPGARRIGILGMGRLGETLLRLLTNVFPDVEYVTWFSHASPKNLVTSIDIHAGRDAKEVARDVDVLFACSSAGSPYLDSSDLGGTRCVINLSLMDFSVDTISESDVVVVDNWSACAAAPKVFRDAVLAGAVGQATTLELPTYLAKDELRDGAGRTFVNLVGMAVEDIVMASLVVRLADKSRCFEVMM